MKFSSDTVNNAANINKTGISINMKDAHPKSGMSTFNKY